MTHEQEQRLYELESLHNHGYELTREERKELEKLQHLSKDADDPCMEGFDETDLLHVDDCWPDGLW